MRKPWFTQGVKHWLWVMTNPLVAYFQNHLTRSQAAFEQLIADWKGILVSDDYGVYQSGVFCPTPRVRGIRT
jgi:hypothetical protein